MHIAQIAPLQVAVPPLGYGGTERVVSTLTETLVALGHDVTLFATGDSHTSARLVPMVEAAINFNPAVDSVALHLAILEEIYARADRFDVIHSHLDFLTLPFLARTTTPTVLTLHDRLDRPGRARAYTQYRGANYVSISDSQRADLPDLNYVATIHHGVDVGRFPFSPTPGNYLAFVGRMSPEKCPDIAIEVAKRTGIPIKIAAKVDHSEEKYFQEQIAPLMDDPLVEWLGQVGEEAKCALMAGALALLAPIDWPEPFGMVFIESLACGTPVLTTPRGAARELLVDGVTGYSRADIDGLVDAVGHVRAISRRGCRAYAQRHFNPMLMASSYVRVYERLVRAVRRPASGMLGAVSPPRGRAERRRAVPAPSG